MNTAIACQITQTHAHTYTLAYNDSAHDVPICTPSMMGNGSKYVFWAFDLRKNYFELKVFYVCESASNTTFILCTAAELSYNFQIQKKKILRKGT